MRTSCDMEVGKDRIFKKYLCRWVRQVFKNMDYKVRWDYKPRRITKWYCIVLYLFAIYHKNVIACIQVC